MALGALLGPRWPQEAPRGPKRPQDSLQDPFWSHFEANLAPFWEGFGSQVGNKLAPNRSKNRFITSLLNRFLMDFGLQLRRPRGSNEIGVGALGVILGHLGAKMGPRPLQEGLGTDFGRFLDRFWSMLVPILVDLLTNVGPFSDQV